VRFRLHPGIDRAKARQHFAACKWVSLRPFIGDDEAELLRGHLLERDDWRLRLRDLEGHYFDLSTKEIQAWGEPKMAAVRALIAPKAGQSGFGNSHSRIRIIDPDGQRDETDSILGEFGEFLFSPPVAELISDITGVAGIDFADTFAARYDPGDYATNHNDGIDQRKSAFVFGLTRSWRVEWGGLLLFHEDEEEGEVRRGLVPAFNCFNLFSVPLPHSVSIVAPFAPEPRLSITGWYYVDRQRRYTNRSSSEPKQESNE
jgi:Rps23 Pro-64 3,4-dihydroxylase Tpa1-like proline 4-hydroxylase